MKRKQKVIKFLCWVSYLQERIRQGVNFNCREIKWCYDDLIHIHPTTKAYINMWTYRVEKFIMFWCFESINCLKCGTFNCGFSVKKRLEKYSEVKAFNKHRLYARTNSIDSRINFSKFDRKSRIRVHFHLEFEKKFIVRKGNEEEKVSERCLEGSSP